MSAGGGGNISIWNTETSKVVRNLKGHTSGIWSLKVLKNGNLASGSGDNTIKIWNTQSGELLRTCEGHTGRIDTLEELNEDGLLASGSTDKTVKIWDFRTGDMLKTTGEMPDEVYKLVLLRDENLAIRCFTQIIIVNGKYLEEVRRIDCGKIPLILMKGKMPGEMTILGDGNLATCDNKIKIWNVSSGRLLRTLEGHNEGIDRHKERFHWHEERFHRHEERFHRHKERFHRHEERFHRPKEIFCFCFYLLDDGNLVSGFDNGDIQSGTQQVANFFIHLYHTMIVFRR